MSNKRERTYIEYYKTNWENLLNYIFSMIFFILGITGILFSIAGIGIGLKNDDTVYAIFFIMLLNSMFSASHFYNLLQKSEKKGFKKRIIQYVRTSK